MKIRNFKLFEDVEVELGRSVVFIGPNNSGKTTALQALALWNIGLKKWNEKRGRPTDGKTKGKTRIGVAINRKDLLSIPTPAANLLWRDLHVRNVERVEGRQSTTNICIETVVDGVSNGKSWSCGLEFDYSNEESFYCRPLRLEPGKAADRMPVPAEAGDVKVAFLPPMSGLASLEFLKHEGEVDVLIGQGQTAEVLRNLCYRIWNSQDEGTQWNGLRSHMRRLFGINLCPPELIPDRSEIILRYRDKRKTLLDISSAGRGLQQVLLLLAHITANPQTVLLIDEPDAHLEILRQREIYRLLSDESERHNSQIVCASHSEVILNEAAGRDMVVAFVGKPHLIDGRISQVLKSLKDIGFEDYYQAEETGWVLYLEGSTDLAILSTFAKTLRHKAADYLERPFVKYVEDNAQEARNHFYGLCEACPGLLGVAIFDRLDKALKEDPSLAELMWKRREIENYLCMPEVLLAYAKGSAADDLFGLAESERRVMQMEESIREISKALRTIRDLDPWSTDTKVTDDFLEPLFKDYFSALGLPLLLRKNQYHELAGLVPPDKIDPEIVEKLDAIVRVAEQARSSE
jgi:energy-coupling factor transporter ATP-binding protein EcfA2